MGPMVQTGVVGRHAWPQHRDGIARIATLIEKNCSRPPVNFRIKKSPHERACSPGFLRAGMLRAAGVELRRYGCFDHTNRASVWGKIEPCVGSSPAAIY